MSDHQLPEGYKQTEIGVIPEDWDTLSIEQLGTVIRGASPRPKGDKRYYGGNIPRLMVEDVTRDGKFVNPSVDFLTEEGAKRSRPCPKGTLTLVCSGTVGVPSFLVTDACIHDGFLALVDVNKKVDSDFLYHFLKTQQSRFDNSATHGGVFTNLTTEIFREFKVPLPCNKEEQRAIAQALSDVDALITSLDKLIAKKRHLKTATMQQLLTGKKRLPGFGGEWQTVNINKHASLKARIGWQALTTEEYLDSGSFFLVTGTDFLNGQVNWSTCHFVDEWRYSQDKNIQLKNGDVLLTKDGTIGKVGYVGSLPNPATLNSGVFVIRPLSESFYPLFLYYILSSQIFDEFLNKIFAGSTISHLYQKDFVTFEFLAPSIKEQQAIATVLSDMDTEIAALENRRPKTQAIKQGMMQELLTGRIRLI
jgi:type I restriction enzyme, S subunit